MCVSPAASDASDTVASLRFGARAKNLPCAPVTHTRDAADAQAATVQALQRALEERDATIEALQQQLAALHPTARSGAGIAPVTCVPHPSTRPGGEIPLIVVTWMLATAVIAGRERLWAALL